ncbi:MAG TPA: 5'/3'-nucleotidase SurE [Desulfobacteria bacterium]|nr:5'/3'-nucleotidase SurE [Desulfobacteria bacterium]
MRILLTNDDGILAPGIQALARQLRSVAEISVVAPDSERSATGHGITLRRPLMVQELDLECGGKGFAVSGTPADCVKLALQGGLVRQPDLVISGINQGQNLGTDVLYSGTVSAAIEAALLGVPGIAVSLTDYRYNDFSFAAEFTEKLCQQLAKRGLTTDTLLNINIPAVPRGQIKGSKVTKLSVIKYGNVFEERVDPQGRKYYWQSGTVLDDIYEEDCDICAIRANQVSITPIHFDLTNYRIMDEIKRWKIDK